MQAAAPEQLRHHRGIGHPQVPHSLDPAELVHHGHRVRVRTHPAGARHVACRTHGAPHVEVQGGVVSQLFVGRRDSKVHHVPVGVGLQEPGAEPDALSHAPHVLGMLEVPVVERRLDARVRRCQPHVARSPRHAQGAGNAPGPLRRHVSRAVARPDSPNFLLTLVHHVHGGQHQVVGCLRVRGSEDQPVVGSVQVRRHFHAVLHLVVDVHAQVVEQALPDPWHIPDDRNPHLFQVVLRADARQHQQLGRPQRPGAEHNLPGLDGEDLPAALRLDAHGLAVVEEYPAHIHLSPHGQVEAMPYLAEVGDRGADPDAAQVVRRGYAHTHGVGPVGILNLRVPLPHARFPECPLDGRLGAGLAAPDRHRPFRSVKVVLDVQVVLHLAEERQHTGVCPLIVPQRGPVVVVFRQAPLHRLAVDGRASADHLALGHVDLSLLLGGHASQGPVMLRVRRLRVPGVAVFHFVRYQVEVRVVLAGLQQQHRPSRVFRQPTGQHRSRRSPSDDNDIVLHRFSSTSIV